MSTENKPVRSFRILEEFEQHYIAIKGMSPDTIEGYAIDIRQLLSYLSLPKSRPTQEAMSQADLSHVDIDLLACIDISDLESFLTWQAKQGAMQSTRARKVSSLRAFFSYLEDRNLINKNPALKLETPKIPGRQPAHLELHEAQALLNTIDNQKGKSKDRDYAIYTVLLNCGLRLSEIQKLNLNDYRTDHLVVLGKGNKERTVFLNDACIRALETYLETRPETTDKALFLSNRKTRISESTIQKNLDKYLRLAGLDAERISVHTLRHTAATLMFKYGDVNIRNLQKILGHANVSTTEIYTHTSNEDLHKAIESNPLGDLKR